MSSSETFRIRDRAALTAAELRNAADLRFSLLENGSLFSIEHGEILINQVLGSQMDGGLGNIYIRRHRGDTLSYFELLGPGSESELEVGAHAISWKGRRDGLEYRCVLRPDPTETLWFWSVHIRNATPDAQMVDAIFTQDLGLGAPAAVRTNELYASQYIDHTVLESREYGYVVCSRQNQQQGRTFPWILHGCLNRATGYSTDGFQFFGLDYKETNVPIGVTHQRLCNRRYQYEFALPALQTALTRVPARGQLDITFFAVYVSDHPDATSERDLERLASLREAQERLRTDAAPTTFAPIQKTVSMFHTSPLFPTMSLTSEDLNRHFGADRRHVEQDDGTVLSFFHGAEHHVVTREKELFSERPHGHILRSGRYLVPDENIMSLTSWMYGVFTSHVAIGNTNFNKALTISRNPLNILKSSGQRVFVKTDTGYALLAMPSAFEMSLNCARWIYKGETFTIIVRVWTSMDDPACFLEISSDGGQPLEFLISTNVVIGDIEYETAGMVRIDAVNARAELIPAPEEMMAQRYPEGRFSIVSPQPGDVESMGGDGLLYADGRDRNTGYVVVKTRPVRSFTLAITGNVLGAAEADRTAARYAKEIPSWERGQREAETFWRGVRASASLRIEPASREVSALNDILPWYAHNALVHFTTPYGLEQSSGAAWGVRDVCQGPTEFLVATRHFAGVKQILRTVYSHQLEQSGDWPQWFMFDRFWDIYAPDSHADVIMWPLNALCDYVEATDDLALLDQELPFTDEGTGRLTSSQTPFFDHTVKQIERMEEACLAGTALIGYGHGDWEDTLQPADPAARNRWVSPWTVELMYGVLGRYAAICELAGRSAMAHRLKAMCDRIREDFNRHLLVDGIVPGLVDFLPKGNRYLLHPADEQTGVRYRLLPMTRGIISGMFTPEQMRPHLAIIDEHLTFPDGVRLMDRPIAYHGGVERLFKRAETAANFGREIGLQYVHAHIRYVQAMARIGRADEAYRGLLMITPIGIEHAVPAACRRQSNTYFSSSDAAFADRYEALAEFDRLRRSEIGIKGGWRVYSSGPGMFIAQLIMTILGLREHFSDVLLDPVLPERLDGLAFDFEYEGKAVRYLYRVKTRGYSPDLVLVNGRDIAGGRYADNPYRRGGMLIPRDEFRGRLDREQNLVEIHV